MRHFHSYGPVSSEAHFCVPRKELVNACAERLIGGAGEEGGHYFTIWAPRQTGKTWLMREAKKEIESRYGERFVLAKMSMQGVIMAEDATTDYFLGEIPPLMRRAFGIRLDDAPPDWKSFTRLFERDEGVFDRPVILFIDEFDSLPPDVIDRLVTLFRDLYLSRESYLLHGLALIGVRAVLGVESHRGSPFNVQRSLHIPNFLQDEVVELFRQYQDESGQKVEPQVVAEVYRMTRGQPGLVCWFGELLTETYNPGQTETINRNVWERTYRLACQVEWNNTTLNLLKKVRTRYVPQALELFGDPDVPFRFDAEWCNYLYLNGVIDRDYKVDEKGKEIVVCRFSSPFVQERLYNALTDDLVGGRTPIHPFDLLDDLADVFDGDTLNLPALLERYQSYLGRLAAKGIDPWKEQPRRSDLHLTEAVGHFHLYAWLQAAVGRRCTISPEFPTGNGKVDLHLSCGDRRGIIEVKSFVDLHELAKAREQAAGYAASLGLDRVTIALFAPSKDESVLQKLSDRASVGGVEVCVVAIGWAEG